MPRKQHTLLLCVQAAAGARLRMPAASRRAHVGGLRCVAPALPGRPLTRCARLPLLPLPTSQTLGMHPGR